jgi:hypothetical protein
MKARDYSVNLIIFSCSPRPRKTSNTAAIVEAFKDGYSSEEESDVGVYYLYERSEWDSFRKVFEENTEIIFAMPLFVECIPGLLMEFVETIKPKTNNESITKIGFIVQGGFDEACQLRTCEKYLEKLPSYLSCKYSGTLIKGGMFALSIVSDSSRKKMLQPFFDMGKIYADEKTFEKTKVTKFAAPEKYSKLLCFLAWVLSPISIIAWIFLSRKLGVNGKINARPFEI